jgi:hypothetical protein
LLQWSVDKLEAGSLPYKVYAINDEKSHTWVTPIPAHLATVLLSQTLEASAAPVFTKSKRVERNASDYNAFNAVQKHMNWRRSWKR